MKTKDRTILEKIHAEASEIDDLIKGYNEDSFISDTKTKKAVCMTLINIGELISHLTPELRNATNHVPWKKISGLRNVAAHSYSTLRMDDVWSYASIDTPVFKQQIQGILDKGIDNPEYGMC